MKKRPPEGPLLKGGGSENLHTPATTERHGAAAIDNFFATLGSKGTGNGTGSEVHHDEFPFSWLSITTGTILLSFQRVSTISCKFSDRLKVRLIDAFTMSEHSVHRWTEPLRNFGVQIDPESRPLATIGNE